MSEIAAKNWGVEIHWLEYKYDEVPANRWKRVTFETASRDGEPFFELIDQKRLAIPAKPSS